MTDATTPSPLLRSRLLRGSDAILGPSCGQKFLDPHPPSSREGVAGASWGPSPKFTTQKRHDEETAT